MGLPGILSLFFVSAGRDSRRYPLLVLLLIALLCCASCGGGSTGGGGSGGGGATDLGCVFMTSEYEILPPDESMVLANINHSTAKKFVDDPVSTLQGLDQQKMQERMNHITKDPKNNPPQ